MNIARRKTPSAASYAGKISLESTKKAHAKPGVVIAGTHSGVGKTTVSLGLTAAFKRRGLNVQPFKVGPDFIDPGHHTRIAGNESSNLDGWMLSRETNRAIFHNRMAGADIALVEGVMGLYDGYDGLSEAGSTAQTAKWLNLPVLLVVDARAMARSAGAVVLGFKQFDPDLDITGVIFNRIGGKRHMEMLEQAMDSVPGVTCLGGLPREAEIAIPERHLGLVTGDEFALDDEVVTRLADLMEEHLDLDGLLEKLWQKAAERVAPDAAPVGVERFPEPDVRIGVARDKAFCFYYPENLDLLRSFGASIVPFSPLTDESPPEGVHGLYFGGGYPEVFAKVLSENAEMRNAVSDLVDRGLPIYAECGGLMYLCRGIEDMDGRTFPMAGVLPMEVRMLKRLRSLGYREVTLSEDGLLGPAGTVARGHEFHYSELSTNPEFSTKPGGLKTIYRIRDRSGGGKDAEGYVINNVLASYVHLHFGSNPKVAENLVRNCREYKERT